MVVASVLFLLVVGEPKGELGPRLRMEWGDVNVPRGRGTCTAASSSWASSDLCRGGITWLTLLDFFFLSEAGRFFGGSGTGISVASGNSEVHHAGERGEGGETTWGEESAVETIESNTGVSMPVHIIVLDEGMKAPA